MSSEEKVAEHTIELGVLLSRLEGQVDPKYAAQVVRKLVDAAKEVGREEVRAKCTCGKS